MFLQRLNFLYVCFVFYTSLHEGSMNDPNFVALCVHFISNKCDVLIQVLFQLKQGIITGKKSNFNVVSSSSSSSSSCSSSS
jgi:hypothetical protein